MGQFRNQFDFYFLLSHVMEMNLRQKIIERFHSHEQRPCRFTETKENVCIK